MNRILAMAAITVTDAVRSRALGCVVALLAAVVVLVPLTVQADGTLAGEAAVILRYTLGLCVLLLGLATLWGSCAAVARDIEQRQIHLVVTKPVHRGQVWLGKWLGLLWLNAALLLFAGAATYAMLRVRAAGRYTPAERSALFRHRLSGRRILRAPEPSPAAEVAARMERVSLPPGMSRAEARRRLEQRVRQERNMVPPAASRSWEFRLPARIAPGAPLSVRYRLSSSMRHVGPVHGTWQAIVPGRPPSFVHQVRDQPAGVHGFRLPDALALPGETLRLVFTNPRGDDASTIVFSRRDPVVLQVRRISFERNLLRALLVTFFHLALLAALGLAASSLFSLPVATFLATSVVIAAALCRYFAFASSPEQAAAAHHHHGPPAEQREPVLLVAAEHTARAVTRVLAPAVGLGAVRPLSEGVIITVGHTGRAFVWLVVVYGGAAAALGAAALRRRELALPA